MGIRKTWTFPPTLKENSFHALNQRIDLQIEELEREIGYDYEGATFESGRGEVQTSLRSGVGIFKTVFPPTNGILLLY